MTIKVSVYSQLAYDVANNPVGAPQEPAITGWSLPVGPTSIQSPAFPSHAKYICIKVYEDCALAFGADPVADPELHTADAGERLYFGISPGHKLAVIAV